MADITWDDVVAHASELSTVATAAQNDILAHVNTALAVDLLDGEAGARTKLARIFLAAHFGTLVRSGGTGAAGPVIAETVGGISRRYADVTGSADDGGRGYERTSYGQLYLTLVATSAARGPMVL